jgi:hypothetical protein
MKLALIITSYYTSSRYLGRSVQQAKRKCRISGGGATQHTRQPANRNRVIHDISKRGGGIST